MNKHRVELSIHTNMSIRDGINTASEYVNEAFNYGIPAIAITDHGSVQAFPEAYKASQKLNFDVKVIYGVESTYTKNDGGKKKRYNISILAKNKQGLKDLYRLVSDAHTKYFDKCPVTSLDEIEKYRANLIIGNDAFGELFFAIIEGQSEEKIREIASFYDYLQIHPLDYYVYYVINDVVGSDEEIISAIKKIVSLGDELGKLVVATDDAHFIFSDDGESRKVIQYKKGYENYKLQPNLYLRSTDEMLEEFAFLGKEKAYEVVVANTQKIADAIDDKIEPFPQEREYPRIKNADERIEMWAYIGARKQYGNNIPLFVEERLKWELEKINENGFADLYLIAAEMIKPAQRKGYVTGVRGPIGSSLVAYFLEITETNPVAPHYYCSKCSHAELHKDKFCGCDMPDKRCPECGELLLKDGFNIPSETFMGLDGDKEPSFELLFAPEIQDAVLERLAKQFGKDKVIQAGTVCSIGEVQACLDILDYCKHEKIKYSCDRMNQLIGKIKKVKRTTGMHPSGIFIIPKNKEIHDYTPIQHPANNIGCGYSTTHFDWHALSSSLYKFDVSMSDTPSMLYKLEKLTGVNAESIPFGDIKTMNIFSRRKTCGVPYFSNLFVKDIMRKIDINCFNKLIKILGLSHGTDAWENNAEYYAECPDFNLSDIISTRDDLTLYLRKNGYEQKEAFRIAERVRKGMGLTKEQTSEMLHDEIPGWFIDSCNTIKYLITRAHAASYALLAYRVAYYKAHYPLEFYCVYFSINADGFDADLLIYNADVLYEKINELKNSDDKYHKSYLLDMMEVCQEMYEKGFRFVSEHIKNDRFESFFIEDGKLRPKLKYN